jgi:hypothetical protein
MDDNWIQGDVVIETAYDSSGVRTWKQVRFSDRRSVPTPEGFPSGIPEDLLRIRPGFGGLASGPIAFDLRSRLRIQFPADPGKPKELVKGTEKLPIAFLVHGHAAVNFMSRQDSFQGFGELQDTLARAGMVSVSVDMNVANAFNAAIEMRAEMLIAAIETMKKLDADTTSVPRPPQLRPHLVAGTFARWRRRGSRHAAQPR